MADGSWQLIVGRDAGKGKMEGNVQCSKDKEKATKTHKE